MAQTIEVTFTDEEWQLIDDLIGLSKKSSIDKEIKDAIRYYHRVRTKTHKQAVEFDKWIKDSIKNRQVIKKRG